MSDCHPGYPDIVVVAEIQEPFPGELGPVVGDDRFWTPKRKTMSWTKLTACWELILAKGQALIDPFSELINRDK
jgi:hypothetical protein